MVTINFCTRSLEKTFLHNAVHSRDSASCATSTQSHENSNTTSERESIRLTPSTHVQTTQTESDHQSDSSGLTSYTLVSNDALDVISLSDGSTAAIDSAL